MDTNLQEIKNRCEQVGYKVEIQENQYEELESKDTEKEYRLIFWSETEEEKKFSVRGARFPAYLVATEFDKFQPLDEYEAIWNKEDRIIECGLETGQGAFIMPSRIDSLARFFNLPDEFENEQPTQESVSIPSPREGVEISLRFCSYEYIAWRRLIRKLVPVNWDKKPNLPVLRIKGVNVNSKHDAKDVLVKIANTVLFQIDLKTESPLSLKRRPENQINARMPLIEDRTLRAPDFEYDNESMSLYWYGRSARQSPLLSFLALYQVVEFYFPAFSTEKVQEAVKNILKDPRFNMSNDTHIARLISAIKPNASGKGYGNERAQLQATIQSCITPTRMREFFDCDEKLKSFYIRQGKQKMPIVDKHIPINSEGADLRSPVAERLYDIRCRIVHTKQSDDNMDILLPFSSEAAQLHFDILLIQFVARQVLIATSRPLRI